MLEGGEDLSALAKRLLRLARKQKRKGLRKKNKGGVPPSFTGRKAVEHRNKTERKSKGGRKDAICSLGRRLAGERGGKG